MKYRIEVNKMLLLVIGMAVGLLGMTIAGRNSRRRVSRNLEPGHGRLPGRNENTRYPLITEKERELY
ncbi:hypothetical protein KGY77_09025 [Candidatus Bipolaricaulota bacterium]|nr:hypothetical protein [Candidatus Bipolaricaulota bacterium]